MAYYGGTAEDISVDVTLYFRAEGLKDCDTFSKSDPYLTLHHYTNGKRDPHVLLKTETVNNNLNPTWSKGVTVPYHFEQKQSFCVLVTDDDGGSGEELFCQEFLLAHVMSSRGACLKLTKGKSSVFITGTEDNRAAKDQISFNVAGYKLKNMDTFGKSDPYFILYRLLPSGKREQLYKSETIDDNLNPSWKVCPNFGVGQLTAKNANERGLVMEVYDEDNMSDDIIGYAKFSFNELLAHSDHGVHGGKANKQLTNDDGFVDVSSTGQTQDHAEYMPIYEKLDQAERHDGKVAGYIKFNRLKIIHKATFAEHLAAGLQMNLAVSIDFTGSNGDPCNPTSLHYMNPSSPNQYVQAIMSVGDILMQYDTDKMIPAFGFGARLPDNQVSHFFHLNLSENPYLHGIQNLLDTYSRTLGQVRLSGPTNFAPSIRSITQGALKTSGVYTVHLILTDGEITDMSETIDAIVDAATTPLSIVIVGVGSDCDFKMMDQLDGDGPGGLRSNATGKSTGRDLVQFVPFSKFLTRGPAALAAEVLKEIPGQVEKWAEIANIQLKH